MMYHRIAYALEDSVI